MANEREILAGMDAISVATGHEQLPKLTRQEAEFAATLAATNNIQTSSKRAGIAVTTGQKWAKNPSIAVHVESILAKHKAALDEQVKYTLADAHADIEYGKRMAANATEWFKGVEMHMRLHGLDTKKTEVNVNVANVTSRTQLENLDDEEILKMAGFSYADILPEAIEGEFREADE